MPNIVVVGLQWGDEGKGKVSHLLSEKVLHVVRSQGGNNAGHTIVFEDNEFKLHLVPSGILYPHTKCYIGPGVVLDLEVLEQEIKGLNLRGIDFRGRLFISPLAHVIFPFHKSIDSYYEKIREKKKIGTTKRGIGPCYADKALRLGIRIRDLFDKRELKKRLEERFRTLYPEEIKKERSVVEMVEYAQRFTRDLSAFVENTEDRISMAMDRREPVLFEGAQGALLDTNFGTYPFVTSSSTLSCGVLASAGVGPGKIDHVLGIVKAYTTRVGSGPFPTELSEEEMQNFPDPVLSREKGTTTGRTRRVGWLDVHLVKKACRLNGATALALTKLDILDEMETIKICVKHEYPSNKPFASLEDARPCYEELPGWKTSTAAIKDFVSLPKEAKNFIQRVEELCGIPASILSFGPEKEKTICNPSFFESI